ncbi:MAG: hypothetical protein AAFS07_09660 [Pseudomonadota bacterium]
MAYADFETTTPSLIETDQVATAGPGAEQPLWSRVLIGLRAGLAASQALANREEVAGACVAKNATEEFRKRFFG